MALPFVSNKEGSVSMEPKTITRKSDGKRKIDPVEVAAEELLIAIKKGNVNHIAQALRAAFIICDSEPHIEGPHKKGK